MSNNMIGHKDVETVTFYKLHYQKSRGIKIIYAVYKRWWDDNDVLPHLQLVRNTGPASMWIETIRANPRPGYDNMYYSARDALDAYHYLITGNIVRAGHEVSVNKKILKEIDKFYIKQYGVNDIST
jgi:hypothetical protein